MPRGKCRERRRRSREQECAQAEERQRDAQIGTLKKTLWVALKKASDPVRRRPVLDPVTGKGEIDHGVLWPVLLEIDRSGLGIWKVAEGIDLNEEERLMIVQVIDRQLPGNGVKRHE